MPKNKYRAVKTDEEYFDNWVEKLDLLCKPQSEIGMLGSCFFMGLMITIFWAPQYSDKHGRLFLVQLTLAVQLTALIGFCFVRTLE
jgi:MFS family permease